MLIRLALKFQERMRPSKAIEPGPGERRARAFLPPLKAVGFLPFPSCDAVARLIMTVPSNRCTGRTVDQPFESFSFFRAMNQGEYVRMNI
jgi:hypothetical protein